MCKKQISLLFMLLVNAASMYGVDFREHTILSYGGSQDVTGTAVVEDSGATLHLTGNVWKCIQYPYNITPNTALEFDFQSDIQGEEHCIGMDADLTIQQDNRFKLYGTQATGTLLLDFNNYASYAPNTRHYVIPIGQYYTGQMQYLFFVDDHDVTSPTGESVYSNVLIYESGEFPPQPASIPQPTHGDADVSTYPELTLSWVAGSGSDSHDVYFGTNANPAAAEYMGNQTENTFSRTNLSLNATYYWRIDEVNEHGVTAGPVWSFTTSDFSNVMIDDFEAYYGNSRYARRDSNPQPSDRQAFAGISQVIVNKEVTRNAKMGLPPGLPPEYLSDPELVMIVEKWPEIPLFIKQAIMSLML